jgi:hypothetical protein
MSILGALARTFKRGAEGIGQKAAQFGRTAKSFVRNPKDTLKRAGKDIAGGVQKFGRKAITTVPRAATSLLGMKKTNKRLNDFVDKGE